MATLLSSFLLLFWATLSCSAEQSSENGTLDWGLHWQKLQSGMPYIPTKWHNPADIARLPTNFDLRAKWPFCESLNEIYDQGNCGSCWVFGSVPAITDRICIASNGTKRFHASPEDALTCSGGGNCQQGGDPLTVYIYWKTYGIVSGGTYNTSNGCKPYTIPPCKNHFLGLPCDPHYYVHTSECRPYCERSYHTSYENDREFAREVYIIEGEDNIKAELYLNGPVSAIMTVYEDFLTYKCGIYRYRLGKYWYGHVVKLLGWGEEDGVKYWLAANSWNVEWGEKGFFKIVRGENNCNIESFVIAGSPKV